MIQAHLVKPSPKIISLGIIILAITVSTILLKLPAGIIQKTPGEARITEPVVRNSVTEIDSDGDGLKDWEEALWKTDPKLPDTDGDGVSDKSAVVGYQQKQEEIRKTTLEEARKILSEQARLLSSGEITASEAASRGLVAQLFLYEESGTPITSESVAAFTKGLTQNAVRPTVYTTYTTQDVLSAKESGAPAVKKYGNAVGTILSNVIEPDVPHELMVFVQFAQDEDVEKFQAQMEVIDSRYEYTITHLLATPVPAEMLSAHINLLNALSKTRADLQHMALISGNAFEAMLAFEAYEKNTNTVAEVFAQIRGIFETMRVIFNETEPGYVLTVKS